MIGSLLLSLFVLGADTAASMHSKIQEAPLATKPWVYEEGAVLTGNNQHYVRTSGTYYVLATVNLGRPDGTPADVETEVKVVDKPYTRTVIQRVGRVEHQPGYWYGFSQLGDNENSVDKKSRNGSSELSLSSKNGKILVIGEIQVCERFEMHRVFSKKLGRWVVEKRVETTYYNPASIHSMRNDSGYDPLKEKTVVGGTLPDLVLSSTAREILFPGIEISQKPVVEIQKKKKPAQAKA